MDFIKLHTGSAPILVNISNIQYVRPWSNWSRIYFVGRDEPLDIDESYDTVSRTLYFEDSVFKIK